MYRASNIYRYRHCDTVVRKNWFVYYNNRDLTLKTTPSRIRHALHHNNYRNIQCKNINRMLIRLRYVMKLIIDSSLTVSFQMCREKKQNTNALEGHNNQTTIMRCVQFIIVRIVSMSMKWLIASGIHVIHLTTIPIVEIKWLTTAYIVDSIANSKIKRRIESICVNNNWRSMSFTRCSSTIHNCISHCSLSFMYFQ